MAGDSGRLFLGLEISTQQVKVLVADDSLKVVYEDAISFDKQLPEFRTDGGVHIHDDKLMVTAPTLMWIKAVDLALSNLKHSKYDLHRIAAVSGTGQQHGSVYWKTGASKKLTQLDPKDSMFDQLQDCFSVADSPLWMDASTTMQCRQLEEAVGGPQALSDITGSVAEERLSGNQVAKIFQETPDVYKDTERIGLVSSLGCSLFLGDYAPIDLSDGSGMNLLDITNHQWNQKCLDACAPDLGTKLGEPVASSSCVGSVSSYMVDRYGFSPDCKVVAFTGDNPASLAGMALQQGDVIMSLGTSDCLFLWLDNAKPELLGSILVNPIETKAYMGMLVYKNGSLTREKVRDSASESSWVIFNNLLESTNAGNEVNVAFWYAVQEITPFSNGVYRFDAGDNLVSQFPPEVEVRAIIEGQFLAKRIHAEALGYTLGANSHILATGGASQNVAILQVLSDVFQAPVHTLDIANSAVLGCAYRAKHGLLGGTAAAWQDIINVVPPLRCAAQPNSEAHEIYNKLEARYKKLEQSIQFKNKLKTHLGGGDH